VSSAFNWYVQPSLERVEMIKLRTFTSSSVRCGHVIAGVFLVAVTLAGCGAGARLDASEPRGNFTVSVPTASFPIKQSLSQHSQMLIVVHNAGRKAIPDVAVTICNVSCSYRASDGQGTSVQAFATKLDQAYLADPSRPVWIVDRPPGNCLSCQQGGPGSGTTAYSNTWALGRLKPGADARFEWGVTAVKPGQYTVVYEVAAGLNGKARAVLAGGGAPHGSFTVTVRSGPTQAYVNNAGKIVTTPATATP
jgi:hypothetical protein